MQSMLNLTGAKAKDFLLKGTSYFNGDLPKYFSFDTLLSAINNVIDNRQISDFYADDQEKRPKNFSDVNYKIITNKDGNLDWRSLYLIHPVLYVDLVNLICKTDNWDFIKKRFAQFQSDKHIVCASVPVYTKTNKKSQKSEQVRAWLSKVEKASILQVLDYEHMVVTDIANCYPSIYTHSIAWALHGKENIKMDREGKCLGNEIDKKLMNMSYGQSNGIPQGSVLMDFIAEIVLGYADLLLVNKIKEIMPEANYHIIRYRDDYRIFTKDNCVGEFVLQTLSNVLQNLGLKLNNAKTYSTNNIIKSSIKPEKLGKSTLTFNTNITRLLYIYNQSLISPNAGNLNKLLADFLDDTTIQKSDNKPVLLSVATDIAYNNPKTYPQIAAIISRIIEAMGHRNKKKIEYINKIKNKFTYKPNTSSMNIWLQRITFPLDPTVDYDEDLCKVVAGIKKTIWNNEWLKGSILSIIESNSIVDKDVLNIITPVIPSEEVNLFSYESSI